MKRLFLSLSILLSAWVVSAQQTQVWDFGAQQFADYQNMLTVEEINSWFPDAEPGSTGVTISNITASESCNFYFNGAGKSNHRLRTTNESLTCYDRKSLKDADGNVYSGYIYSNAGSTPEVYIEQTFESGDKVEYYVGSNGNAETYALKSPSGEVVEQQFTNAAKIEKLTFYIGETGKHRFYGIDEKLVVARIVRTPAKMATLTGRVVAPKSIPDNYELVFTNTSTGQSVNVKPDLDTYVVEGLPLGYEYKVSLANANGYIVSSESIVVLTDEQQQFDIAISSVSLVTLTGVVSGLPAEQLGKVEFAFTLPDDKIYQPEYIINRQTGDYVAVLETGVKYKIEALNVNDYQLKESVISAKEDGKYDIVFAAKPLYVVTIEPTVATLDDLQQAVFTFTNLNEEGYVYKFDGPKEIRLRTGVYSVEVSNLPHPFYQLLTSNLKVVDADVTKVIDFGVNGDPVVFEYFEKLYVSPSAFKDYVVLPDVYTFRTINEALDAVRAMNRTPDQRVTIYIEPGNYEEMLKVNVNNVTLRNSATNPTNLLKNGGVDIDENAVRITGYYGHGYNYASMGKDFFWDARTLQVNKENGYPSVVNQGGSSSTYWNATVLVSGKGFEAYDIIFENSYNQYVSQKESEDLVVEIAGAGKGVRPTDAGNTSVQNRSFRERACALAFTKTSDRAYLENCRIVGRQDALYGDQGARVAVQGGVLMGACDYIFGGMTLVCNQTELAMLVSDDKNDVTYITAAKQDAGVRGYLFNDCHVTSAQPQVDMVETAFAKPGYWGRPWSANAETVFFNTVVDDCQNTAFSGKSLINADGWNNGLTSSGSPRSFEYNTQECVDNSAKRLSWATVLTDSILPDGTAITLFNFTKGSDNWDPFNQNTSGLQTIADGNLEVTVCANNGMLNIVSAQKQDITLQVYDMAGRVVAAHSFSDTISLPLAHGLYVVKLQSNGTTSNVKILL